MVTSRHSIDHVRVETEEEFAEVTKDLERRLGKYDPTVFQSLQAGPRPAEDATSRIEAMAGTSGFILFGTTDHGALLSIFGESKKAVQYVVGNPLFAIQMTRHNLGAGLYAPLRVLIYEDDRGKTCLEYDTPSSLFSQFNDDRIASVATILDRKREDLVAEAVG